MRRCLPLILIWGVLTPALARAVPVTFQVDLGPYQAAGYFDPATDAVELRGDFGGWLPGPRLQAVGGASGGLLAVTVDLAPGAIAHKFLIVRSGGAEVWEEDVPNRVWQVPAAGGSLPPVFFNDLAATVGPAERVVGADLSFAPWLTSLGGVFRRDGQPAPLLDLVGEAGLNLVRLRLWHTPAEPWHGLEATVAHARQVQAAGLPLLLDLHYSDTWADPGHQTPPAAWQGLGAAALADSVAASTARVIGRFTAEGIVPRYVQVGNEIDAGLLWDTGRVGWPGSEWDTPAQWAALTALLQAGAGAVRAALPAGADTELIIHLAAGGDNARCRWFLDELAAAGVDHDVIGLSYYPWWHGSLWDLQSNLRDLGPRYGKQTLVVETAYPWTLDAAADGTGNFVTADTPLPAGYPATPQGQLDFLRDVRRVTETSGGLGVVYWEPDFLPVGGGPGNPCENLTLFDFVGEALPGLGFGAAAGAVAPAPVPRAISLEQNRPNPFNPETAISFHLEQPGPVSLKVYDAAGRLVCTLADSTVGEGWHEVRWRGRDARGQAVPSGVYFYELVTEAGAGRRSMVLVR